MRLTASYMHEDEPKKPHQPKDADRKEVAPVDRGAGRQRATLGLDQSGQGRAWNECPTARRSGRRGAIEYHTA